MKFRNILMMVVALTLVSTTTFARKVKGTVRCGSEPLSGVLVTDGEIFVRTNSRGAFRMDIEDDAMFVYVVSPNGYVPDYSTGAPQFYQKAAGRSTFSFNLQKWGDTNDYTLFSVSDPQFRNTEQLRMFTGAPLEDLIEQAATGGPNTVGIALGDICWDVTDRFPEYKEAIARTGIPFYGIIGNHDFDKDAPHEKVAQKYLDAFGPYNYAFYLGDDLVIGLNDIIYDTNKNYVEGYSEKELSFVRNLLANVPASTHLYIAQHSPLYFVLSGKKIQNADEMLSLLEGRKVDFLSGHTHIMNNIVYSDDIMEHNAASICGDWWATTWTRTGEPRGYEIFTEKGGKLSWRYHPIDYDEDYQFSVIEPGQSRLHPNDIVVNAWDYDPEWKITWDEDGVPMGEMKMVWDVDPTVVRQLKAFYTDKGKAVPDFRASTPNCHYFAATPSRYAKSVTVHVTSRFGKKWDCKLDMTRRMDVLAHRGGAGLLPENTIPAMVNAVKLGANSLELDLQLSSDGQVVVSHDKYFLWRYSTRPDGTTVSEKDPKEYIYTMPYSQVRKYDVGLKEDARFPDKERVAAYKPLLGELVDTVENFVRHNGLSPMSYNIELKSSEGENEGKLWADYRTLADNAMELLLSKGLGDRLLIQSFDPRTLDYVHEKYPGVRISYLTDRNDTGWKEVMGRISFKPDWLSPEWHVVTEALVKECHDKGIMIVPWTVDDKDAMRSLMELGVDGIITNYPDQLLDLTRGY